MTKGQRVYWTTGHCDATVIKESEYGDVVIQPVVGKLPITTRKCFLVVIDNDF